MPWGLGAFDAKSLGEVRNGKDMGLRFNLKSGIVLSGTLCVPMGSGWAAGCHPQEASF